MKKFLIIFFAGVVSIAGTSLFAEATKELYNDNGLYGGKNPSIPEPMNVMQWAFSYVDPGLGYTGEPGTPEGTKCARTYVNMNWGGWGIFNVDAWGSYTKVARNWSDYAGGALRFQLKSQNALDVEVEYAAGKRKVTVPSTGGEWKEIVLPFSLFPAGIDFTQITGPFLITVPASAGEKTWFVDHIRWTKPLASLQIIPSTTEVNPGKHRQFTVEGRDAAGEYVVVYSQFTAPANVGTLNPASPANTLSAVLTANTTTGKVTGTALRDHMNYMSVQADAVNTTADLSSVLGVLTENTQIPALNLSDGDPGQDGAVVIFPELTDTSRPNDPPALSNDYADFIEGAFSVKTVFASQGDAGYGGWAVQWGKTSTTDAHTRNMAQFYDGYLRFWFKGPSALASKLSIGIRSGNVPAGKEYSKVLLSAQGVPFDNMWHPVEIPLSIFAKSPPWADLARTKVFIAVTASGALGGTTMDRTCYFDHVRWDTKQVGALATIQVVPNTALVPTGARRIFTARGFDANGNIVDIFPTWDMPDGSLGTLTATNGISTILNASNSPVTSRRLRATVGGVSGSASVSVENVNFAYSYNVYSDAGVGGSLGTSTAPASPTNTFITPNFSETAGGAPEGTKYARSLYTLDDSAAGAQDSFALWFATEPAGSKYMRYFENGYLSFYVRTSKDLEFSIGSAGLNPDTSKAKIQLSELGVPLNNTWQRVLVSFNNFSVKENIDFANIRTYFAIGAVSKQIGEVTNQTFDIDDVKWLTNSGDTPDKAKVYLGVKNKQRPTGLLQSFSDTRAVTYDQALGAMAFTYNKDTALAKKIFDAYKTINPNGNGYANEYNSETRAALGAGDRVSGPNAYLLLALIHYRIVTGSTDYDAMIDGLAAWLKSMQDAGDGAVKYGISSSVPAGTKSTEHNFDCYAAFRAYAVLRNNNEYNVAANSILNWLQTQMWNAGQGRFYMGEDPAGNINLMDKALDLYSWAPLALGTDFGYSLEEILWLAEMTFPASFVNTNNGNLITGVDFGAFAGAPPDNDAVWLEGTAQLAVANGFVGNTAVKERILNELRKAIFSIDANSQGLTYATNRGTAYPNWYMPYTEPALSSMAWYLFAEYGFNPFNVYPIHTVKVRNISDNAVVSQMGWTVSIPQDRWVRANQYVEIINQPVTKDAWGVQIYTDNTNPSSVPRFVDLTPLQPNNKDSNPAGLLFNLGNPSVTGVTVPLAWSIKDFLGDAPAAADPDGGTPNSFQWLYIKDKATPAIDLNEDGDIGDSNDGTPFTVGERWVTVLNQNGMHAVQGPVGSDFFSSSGPDYVFFEANFLGAAAQVPYKTNITFEYYLQ